MDGITDFQARKLENKLRRDVVGGAQHFDFVANDVQNAAGLQAGAFFFAFEYDRHGSGNFPLGVETQEIDMHRRIRNRMELHVTGQHAMFRACDLDVDQLDKELRVVEFLDEHALLQRQ